MSDLFASKAVMRNYLNALLTEEEEPKAKPAQVVSSEQKKQLSELLAQASPVQAKPQAQPQAKVATAAPVVPAPVVEKPKVAIPPAALVVHDVVKQTPPPRPPSTTVVKDYRQGRFQALFFEVAGLKVALPLKELGGIHQIGPLNTLPGKPAWYKGVM